VRQISGARAETERRPAQLFDPGPGALCPGCEWLEWCGGAFTEHACRPRWGIGDGGEYALHPRLPWTPRFLDAVNGPDYSTVQAQAVTVSELPRFLPQLRARADNGGRLDEPVYAVRAWEVLRERGVRAADELRSLTGLRPDQQLILLLFDRDALLEQLWQDGVRIIPALARAGYDVIVAPSYSAWTPRPRPEFMYSAKRSLEVFGLLQAHGANVIPRLVWVIPHDVIRAARWVLANPAVTWIALDLTTYRDERDFEQQVEGLARFDALTGRRLRYLINGPGTVERCAELYLAAHERRVHLTSSTFAAPPIEGQLGLLDPLDDELARRCAAKRAILDEAEALAARLRRSADQV
jgi:hypothetical protein